MFLETSKIRIYVPIQGKYSNESSIHQNDFFEDYQRGCQDHFRNAG